MLIKTLLVLSLVALACSSSPFLRELQQSSPTDNTTNTTNTTNGTNSTLNLSMLTMNIYSGTYNMFYTDCTGNCFPTFVFLPGINETQVNITVIFPNDSSCPANVSGQNFTVTEELYSGEISEFNTSSPIYGYETVLMYNNNTIDFTKNYPNGSYCDMWYAGEITTTTNTTVPTNKTWEGTWQITSYFGDVELIGQNTTACCLFDQFLISQDLATQTISYAIRAPNCPACQYNNPGQVTFSNASIVGGGAEDPNTYLNFYMMQDETIIFSNDFCIYHLEKIAESSTC